MGLSEASQEQIESAAAEILAGFVSLRLPVSLEDLRGIVGPDVKLQIFKVKFDSRTVRSMSTRHADGTVNIYVSNDLSPEWLRYVTTKEIVHAFENDELREQINIGQLISEILASPIGEPHDEKLARAILMPREIVKKAWPSLGNVEGLAALFQVPEIVAEQRLEDLSIAPTVFT